VRNKRNYMYGLMIVLAVALIGLGTSTPAQTSKSRAALTNNPPAAQQPRYDEYRGVRLGMTVQEVRAKLGNSLLQDAELDYFVISDKETALIGYDSLHKVKAISVDYLGGTGAPEYKAVVGGELESRPDGSMYRIVRYDDLGFWVSYNRSAGPVVTVTITIQKMLQAK
jgi:hypothetical protein